MVETENIVFLAETTEIDDMLIHKLMFSKSRLKNTSKR